MTTKNEDMTMPWFWVIVGFIALATLVESCKGNLGGSSAPASYTPDRSSIEHRYATERFKQEGLSSSEAQKAADAVIKFHNAQKNR